MPDTSHTTLNAPIPALDLSGYTTVTIVRTGEVDGYVYRRGTRPTVDAATLEQLRDQGLVNVDAAG